MKIPEAWFENNPFVYACATGNIEEVKARLKAGEDINQIAHDARYVGGQLSGVGAAMATHRLDVLDVLIAHGADITKTQKNSLSGGYHTAFDTAIESFFWQGVDHLIKHHGIPLITMRGENKDELLFSALPKPTHVHSYHPGSDPQAVAHAKQLDKDDRKNGLATLDYLIDELDLNVDVEVGGMTLLSSANVHSGFDFWGDQGVVLTHLLKRGCNPNGCATKTEPRFKVTFTEEAKEDLSDIFDTSTCDFEEELGLGSVDTLHTSGLIGACYRPDPRIIEIYMNDERSDPLHYDKHGNNAFDMLHATPLSSEKIKEQVATVSAMLKSQVKRIHGYDLYDIGLSRKDMRPN